MRDSLCAQCQLSVAWANVLPFTSATAIPTPTSTTATTTTAAVEAASGKKIHLRIDTSTVP